MGSENNEKWIGRLKDSVSSHSEQLPDNFWEELKKDIPAPAPAAGRSGWGRYMWRASVAAAVLLALVLLVPHGGKEDAPAYVAQETPIPAHENSLPVQENDLPAVENAVPAVDAMEQKPATEDIKDMEETGAGMIVAVGEDKEDAIGNKAGVVDRDIVQEKTDNAEQEGEGKEELRRKEREELLRELEYLHRSGKGEKRGPVRRWLAFAGGNSGISLHLSGNDAYGEDFGRIDADVIPEIPGSAGDPSNGGGNFSPGNQGSIGGFVNMDYQPVGNIVWLGANSPQIFKEEASYKSCTYDHSSPVRFGVSLAWEITEGRALETGVTYQYLRSRMQTGKGTVQKLHYLGIPFRFSGRILRAGSFSVYLSGGYLLEKCIYGVLEYSYDPNQRLHINKLQHSINAALGLQLGVGSGASLYIEPGIYRYLGMDDGYIAREHGYLISSKYSEDPEGYSFQGGVRFTF